VALAGCDSSGLKRKKYFLSVPDYFFFNFVGWGETESTGYVGYQLASYTSTRMIEKYGVFGGMGARGSVVG
jgi:hypothetical protein